MSYSILCYPYPNFIVSGSANSTVHIDASYVSNMQSKFEQYLTTDDVWWWMVFCFLLLILILLFNEDQSWPNGPKKNFNPYLLTRTYLLVAHFNSPMLVAHKVNKLLLEVKILESWGSNNSSAVQEINTKTNELSPHGKEPIAAQYLRLSLNLRFLNFFG